jgi:hypothetical protein
MNPGLWLYRQGLLLAGLHDLWQGLNLRAKMLALWLLLLVLGGFPANQSLWRES